MKTLFLATVLLLALGAVPGMSGRAFGQTIVPNGGFEQWDVDSVPKQPGYVNGTWFRPFDSCYLNQVWVEGGRKHAEGRPSP